MRLFPQSFLEGKSIASATTVISLGGNYDTTRASSLYTMLSEIEGVYFVEFNYTNNKMTVSFDPDRVSLNELKIVIEREKEGQDRSSEKNHRKGEIGS